MKKKHEEIIKDGNSDNVETKVCRCNAKKIREVATVVIGILLAGFIRSISIHTFIVPNGFAPGGITGLSAISEKLWGINSGIMLFVLNLPIIVIAWIFIGKKFAIKTGIAIAVSSLLLLLWKAIDFPQVIGDSSGDKILPALAGGLLSGIAISLIFKIGGSSGGTDVIATLIQKKNSGTNVAWFIFMLDAVVVVGSIFVYREGIVPVLLSFIAMFASSKAVETITSGFKAAIKFEIVTPHHQEISKEIMEKLHRSVTMSTVKGMYSQQDKSLLICIVRRREVSKFKDILKKYPDSFAYITEASEVFGRGFSS